MQYLIVGNSIAAAGAIEGIRSVDKDGRICVIGKERYRAYGRPLISYYLEGKTSLEHMNYKPDDFYEKNNCDLITGISVTKIDAENKKVELSNNEEKHYDKLLLATGSDAFVPKTEGQEKVKNHFTFITLDDALAIEKKLRPDKKVLIVGAGLIGLKCAEGIYKRVKNITVVDMAENILSSILDEAASKNMKEYLEERGLVFKLNNHVVKYDENKAYLANGETVDFDILVTAVGVKANTSLYEEICNEQTRGIECNVYQETSTNDIYAAGDCAQVEDVVSQTRRLLPLLPNAYRSGFAAGCNMAGAKHKYNDSFPMNAIGFFGVHICSAGIYEGECFECIKDDNYKKLFYSNNHLNGFIIIGDVDKVGIYTQLIRKRTPLDEIDFDLICCEPQLMAFSKKWRKENLGGIKND